MINSAAWQTRKEGFMVYIYVIALDGRGSRRSKTIRTPLRHLEDARPWLKAHYPHTRFVWGECIAFSR
jgi:hypothetical protein